MYRVYMDSSVELLVTEFTKKYLFGGSRSFKDSQSFI